MPSGLKRYYGKEDLHFITFSCCRRLPLLKTVRARDLFVEELGRVREERGFRVVTKGVPPAHAKSFSESKAAPAADIVSATGLRLCF